MWAVLAGTALGPWASWGCCWGSARPGGWFAWGTAGRAGGRRSGFGWVVKITGRD